MFRKVVSGVMLSLLLIGIFSLAVNIKPVRSAWTGTVYIRADGSIDPPDAPIITYDNVTYTLTDNIASSDCGIIILRDGIVIDGAGFYVEGKRTERSIGIDVHRINVTVKNFNIRNFEGGIRIYSSPDCTIIENNITLCDFGIGISLDSDRSSIIRNKIIGNSKGISVVASSYNEITGNVIANNSYGIRFGVSVSLEANFYNNIVGNTLQNNEYGVYTYSWTESSYNRFYHNNFIHNRHQAYDPYNNIWDNGYPSGGNYWSDYYGTDLYKGPSQDQHGSDGIGDSPYIIDGQNKDNYPLMYPYGSPPPPYYNLTISTTTGGTTEPPPGTYAYAKNIVVAVTAIPYEDYPFCYWLLDGEVRIENPLTVVMDSNHTLEAHFIDDIPPELSDPWQDPPSNNVQPFQDVTVWVNVTDCGTGIKNVTLWYSLDNGTTWNPIKMTELAFGTYNAIIQGREYCTWITYKIVAYDNAGNNAPKDNNGYGYQYHIIPEFPSSVALLGFLALITIPMFIIKKRSLREWNNKL